MLEKKCICVFKCYAVYFSIREEFENVQFKLLAINVLFFWAQIKPLQHVRLRNTWVVSRTANLVDITIPAIEWELPFILEISISMGQL